MKNTIENGFNEAIELIKIKANAATVAYVKNETSYAYAKMAEVKAITATIKFFTGENIEVHHANIDCTGYKIVQNPYETNESILFEWDYYNR